MIEAKRRLAKLCFNLVRKRGNGIIDCVGQLSSVLIQFESEAMALLIDQMHDQILNAAYHDIIKSLAWGCCKKRLLISSVQRLREQRIEMNEQKCL